MQWLRFLLFPFSILYEFVTRCRNWAFDKGFLKQQSYDIPIIAVGNLSTGGTGKTPMIEWLIEQHQGKKIAVLSRGYGRSTKGYIEISVTDTAQKVGDEPLQVKKKYGDIITSAVCEKRVDGINQLLNNHDLDLILLDDAYQHRYVNASHYILLTSYDSPYYKDFLLPTGNLRESRTGARRAHTIIVTKCPNDISDTKKSQIIAAIKPQTHQKVFFSTIEYDDFIVQKNGEKVAMDDIAHSPITAVTGIAKPKPFIDFLEQRFTVEHLKYGDHYRFRESDVNTIQHKEIVITTEKDYTRLAQENLPNVYYLPMKVKFIGDKPFVV